ncbi:MAG TPA: ATP-binding protein [Acetobacteraceae bacterium]|jgi:signal transduction histidine kinase
MTRLLPRTLFWQMLWILLGGMLVSHVIGSWIYANNRAEAVRAVGGLAATQRIANLARLIDETPPAWRDRIVAAARDATLRVTLSARPPPIDDEDGPVRDYLAAQLPLALARNLRVTVVPAGPPRPGFHHPMRGPWMGFWMAPPPPWHALDATMQLSDGQWLSFDAGLPPVEPLVSWPFIAAMAIMTVIVVAASAWAVRRVTAPLGMMSAAAERLGRDVNAPPIAEAGSLEMRQAAQSFNTMQARLQRVLENRTRMLAALSHDLRTPLTLLRLRTEALPESEERERMLGTLDEADTMVGATLSFARDQTASEPMRRIDVAALVGAIVDDMADAGLKVSMTHAEPAVLECQSGALRRAIGNLIDNALKYGGGAQAGVEAAPDAVRIIVDDDGPGIPEGELQRVFEPFHRLEESRSRDTGGAGLGLSIAQAIVQAHGGEIVLANRPEGGLRAILSLRVATGRRTDPP